MSFLLESSTHGGLLVPHSEVDAVGVGVSGDKQVSWTRGVAEVEGCEAAGDSQQHLLLAATLPADLTWWSMKIKWKGTKRDVQIIIQV